MRRLHLWYLRFLYHIWGISEIDRRLLTMRGYLVIPTLRQFGAKVGAGTTILPPLLLHNAEHSYQNLEIGQDCHLGKGVLLDLSEHVRIEDQVTISMGVSLLTHQDMGRSPLSESYPPKHAPIKVCRGAYIGANATLLCGVTVGEEAIVGAGAVVVADVPPRAIAGGVPAKYIGLAQRGAIANP